MGGGVVGSSIAYHLAKEQTGKKILVVERDMSYKYASAMLSAGGIRQQFSLPENIKISMYGAEFLHNKNQLEVEGNTPDLQFHENGYLFLASTENGAKVLMENHNTQHSCGATWIDLYSPLELKNKFPWLNVEDIKLGSFSSRNEGFFDPWLFLQAIKSKAQALGVHYLHGDVIDAKVSSKSTSSPSSLLIESIRVKRLASDEITLNAGIFVNSAGAWSGALLDRIASLSPRPNSVARLPVHPRKRCIFIVQSPSHHSSSSSSSPSPSPSPSHMVPPRTTPLVVDPSGSYFRPELNGNRFLAGISPHEEEDPNCPPGDCEAACESLRGVDHHLFERDIWPSLAERVKAFEALRVQGSWAGFYDYNTLDQNAIIGPHPELSNLLICTGFSGHGLQQVRKELNLETRLSPAAGRAISELIFNGGKYSTIDLSRLSFQRIVDGKPLLETGIV